jgi:hypothetical protein
MPKQGFLGGICVRPWVFFSKVSYFFGLGRTHWRIGAISNYRLVSPSIPCVLHFSTRPIVDIDNAIRFYVMESNQTVTFY